MMKYNLLSYTIKFCISSYDTFKFWAADGQNLNAQSPRILICGSGKRGIRKSHKTDKSNAKSKEKKLLSPEQTIAMGERMSAIRNALLLQLITKQVGPY